MILKLIILTVALWVLPVQSQILKFYSTANFTVKYDKHISIKEIKQLGTSLESSYTHYKNIFGIAFNHRPEILIFGTVRSFRTESKSQIFQDGDFKDGKLYFAFPDNAEQKERFPYVISRVIARALLVNIPACPEWLVAAYSLYAGNNLTIVGDPARYNISSFSDLSEDYIRAQNVKDLKEIYAKLASTIRFMINRYGESRVESMLKKFSDGGTISEVFESSFNEKMPLIEKAWVKALRIPLKE